MSFWWIHRWGYWWFLVFFCGWAMSAFLGGLCWWGMGGPLSGFMGFVMYLFRVGYMYL
jgi:hypothetical protein